MSIKSQICRLAFSFLNKNCNKRDLSSFVRKCEVKTAPKTLIPHLLLTNFLPAPGVNSTLIDPGLIKIPRSILDVPLSRINGIVDIPVAPILTIIPPVSSVSVEDPTKVIEKQAARLIIIRKRKMRRHKLRKLRKKMRFVWAKQRQKRELKKEKLFQAELMSKIREAEKFDAVSYVENKISKANEVRIPRRWRGKRLPEFIIRDLIAKKEQKREETAQRLERKEKMLKKVKDYQI